MADSQPYIPASKKLPELTIKAVGLGILLAVVLGAANAYLGLRVGMTASASIPAAVMSMAILRLFKRSNILENNAVQTSASAGEALAAGVIFTVPALVILDHWTQINYIQTTLVAVVGGVLGVLFTVPLRRALIVEEKLTFPEGIATSEVLKVGQGGSSGLGALIVGGLIGTLFKFMQGGMHMFGHTAMWAKKSASGTVAALGLDLSPALLGVGYIIRLHIASLVFAGGVIGWVIAMPLVTGTNIDPSTLIGLSAADASFTIWSTKIRYIGVGAMLVGGVWSLIQLRKPLTRAIKRGLDAAGKGAETVLRTEKEFSMKWTLIAIGVLTIPIFALYNFATGVWWIALILTLLMVVVGFLFSAVAGYMAGLVGSSNNPISGVTIIAVMVSGFLLVALGIDPLVGPAATIFVAAVIACAGAIAGDNMQDLKAGYLLGSTPQKQQVMQIVGVVATALAVAPVLQLLGRAYEFGSPELAAPQAGLFAAIAGFMFNPEGGLPMDMIGIGAALAVGLIVTDLLLKSRGIKYGTPVMPVAVGIYLPVGLTTPIFIGGLIAWLVARRAKSAETAEVGHRGGVLFASGLIAGEAIIGIVVAASVVYGWQKFLTVSDGSLIWPGILLFAYTGLLCWYLGMRAQRKAESPES